MTNREWLESLSDEDLVKFFLGGIIIEDKECGFSYNVGLNFVSRRYVNSYIGLKEWLSSPQEFSITEGEVFE